MHAKRRRFLLSNNESEVPYEDSARGTGSRELAVSLMDFDRLKGRAAFTTVVNFFVSDVDLAIARTGDALLFPA